MITQWSLSMSFFFFGVLLLIDAVAGTIYYPENRDFVFWFNLALTFGTLSFWAFLISRKIAVGKGLNAAIIYLSILTFLCVLGAIITAFAAPKPPAHPSTLMQILRFFSAGYALYLWGAVFDFRIRRQK
jgi:hypothetical protein